MSTFQKQLSLHRLPLPVVLIDIINEYIFIDISVKTKRQKDFIIFLINNARWNGKWQPQFELHSVFGFAINRYSAEYKYNDFSPQFSAPFCKKCGDYNCRMNKVKLREDIVICKCNQIM